ncbi:hypothetical protein ABT124_21475 [Streptomyces sp. NPDC001982]|uniref:hypothetical protein n=1 Tax=Streptomyces sp. NPDC001982 TaxID=3154405 RepID=UPI003320B104
MAAAGTHAEKLAWTREQASEAADRLLTVQFDLRDEESIASLVAQTTDRFGRYVASSSIYRVTFGLWRTEQKEVPADLR